ncbi:MAG: HPF/RaiA family ribosome-associated protein [Alphaproteobacteria bacterium]
MDKPVQITFKHLDSAPAVENEIRSRVEGLEKLFPHIVSCRVTVEAPHRHRRHGQLYNVGVFLHVPGHDITVNQHDTRNDAYQDIMVAVHDAFDDATRRLQDAVNEMEGKVKVHAPPRTGRICRLFPEADHGFIETPEGEVYFHRNAVLNDAFPALSLGDEVRLVVAEKESAHGYQATTVHPVGKHHPVKGGA